MANPYCLQLSLGEVNYEMCLGAGQAGGHDVLHDTAMPQDRVSAWKRPVASIRNKRCEVQKPPVAEMGVLRLRRLKYHVAESARSFEIVLNCMSSGNRWNKSQTSAIDVDCFNGGRDKQAKLVCQLPHHAESTSCKGLGNHSHHSPDLTDQWHIMFHSIIPLFHLLSNARKSFCGDF